MWVPDVWPFGSGSLVSGSKLVGWFCPVGWPAGSGLFARWPRLHCNLFTVTCPFGSGLLAARVPIDGSVRFMVVRLVAPGGRPIGPGSFAGWSRLAVKCALLVGRLIPVGCVQASVGGWSRLIGRIIPVAWPVVPGRLGS